MQHGQPAAGAMVHAGRGQRGTLTLILMASLLGRVWSRARSNHVVTCTGGQQSMPHRRSGARPSS